MIERDYIMRMLQDFFSMIAKMLRLKMEEPDMTRVQAYINDLYKQFFRHTAEHFYAMEQEAILEGLKNDNLSESEQDAMMQMLAELLYQDGLIKIDRAEKISLLEKSLFLFKYLDSNSKTFSWDREQKIGDIHNILTEYDINGLQ